MSLSKTRFSLLILVIIASCIPSANAEPEDHWWDETINNAWGAGGYLISDPSKYDDLYRDFSIDFYDSGKGAWVFSEQDFDFIQEHVDLSHEAGVPIAIITGPAIPTPRNELPENCEDQEIPTGCGIIQLYDQLSTDKKWLNPDGTVAEDPYLNALTRSYTGILVDREHGDYSILQSQNPSMLEFQIDWAKKCIDTGAESMFIDNTDEVYPPFWMGGFGGPDTWEGYMFTQYLEDNFSVEELESYGITDLSSFSFVSYLETQKNTDVEWTEHWGTVDYDLGVSGIRLGGPEDEIMEDPVIRAFVIYQYESFVKYWSQYNSALKEYAQDSGIDLLITGNLAHLWHWNSIGPEKVMIADYFDIAMVETDNEAPPIRLSPFYKMAQAATNYDKPVLTLEGGQVNELIDDPPQNMTNYISIRHAEGFANGGIKALPFALEDVDSSWPPSRLITGPERPSVEKYASFNDHIREYITQTETLVDVAVVYSLPDQMWTKYPSLGLWENDYPKEAEGWLRALEELHIQHEIVIFGYPGLFDDTENVDRLSSYEVVVLPSVNCISDTNYEALIDYLENGGKCIVVSDFGERTQDYEVRTENLRTNLLSYDNVVFVYDLIGEDFITKYRSGQETTFALNKIGDAMESVHPSDRLVETDAPSEVMVSLQQANGVYVVHMVNFDYQHDSQMDWVTSYEDILVSVEAPMLYEPYNVRLESPDVGVMDLEFTVDDEYVSFTEPELDVWNMIIIEDQSAYDERVSSEQSSVELTVINNADELLDGSTVSSIHVPIYQEELTGVTNSSGVVSFTGLKSGRYWFSVSADDHSSEVVEVRVKNNSPEAQVVLESLVPVVDVLFSVTDMDEEPLSGVSVSRENSGVSISVGVTDDDGELLLPKMKTLTYTYVLEKDGYQSKTVPVTIEEGDPYEISVKLQSLTSESETSETETSEGTSESEETGGGIPGFNPLSMLTGLICIIWVLYVTRHRII